MAMIACTECHTEISSKAKACPKCGAKVPHTKWWLWVPLGAVAGLFVIGMFTGPKNTTELGQMETASCLRNQGDGEWRGSMSMSLDEFCRAKGNMLAMRRACEIDPSRC